MYVTQKIIPVFRELISVIRCVSQRKCPKLVAHTPYSNHQDVYLTFALCCQVQKIIKYICIVICIFLDQSSRHKHVNLSPVLQMRIWGSWWLRDLPKAIEVRKVNDLSATPCITSFVCVWIGLATGKIAKLVKIVLFDSASCSGVFFVIRCFTFLKLSWLCLPLHTSSYLLGVPYSLHRYCPSAHPHLTCQCSSELCPEPFSCLIILNIPGGYLPHL